MPHDLMLPNKQMKWDYFRSRTRN